MANRAETPTLRRRVFGNFRWIPWAFVGAFVIVFAVNGGLVYFASASWPGLTNDNAYNDGNAYNRVIDESAKEAELGWKIDILYQPAAQKSGGQLVLAAHDPTGVALDGIVWQGELVRPVGKVDNVPVRFVAQGDGQYTAVVVPPLPGQWTLYLTASRGEIRWHGGERLVVPSS